VLDSNLNETIYSNAALLQFAATEECSLGLGDQAEVAGQLHYTRRQLMTRVCAGVLHTNVVSHKVTCHTRSHVTCLSASSCRGGAVGAAVSHRSSQLPRAALQEKCAGSFGCGEKLLP